MMADMQNQPVSRTYQYRKVMKPMLERKRRARINRCLDELKELMVTALQSEGENVSKLEKADILELTVRHLQSLRSAGIPTPAGPPPPPPAMAGAANHNQHHDKHHADRYEEGWTACLEQVSQFLHEGGAGGLPRHEALRLMSHLTPEMPRSQEEPLWRPW